jgi:PBP1b-binding outer membrane lipoprotein LpoB
MKTIKIKFYITVLLVAMLTVSCAAPITTKFSHNTVEIERGDSTQIFWEFSMV